MINRLTLISLCAAPVALTACTTADSTSPSYAGSADGDACFFLSQVSGFNDAPDEKVGTDRIYVSVGAGDKYLFETFGPCPSLNWSETLGFDQRGPGRICNGMDVDLIVPDSIGPPRCPVRMIRELSRAEIEAM